MELFINFILVIEFTILILFVQMLSDKLDNIANNLSELTDVLDCQLSKKKGKK